MIEEGYEINIKEEEIELKGNSEKGLFYAIITLGQILGERAEESKKNGKLEIECMEIKDEPRFW